MPRNKKIITDKLLGALPADNRMYYIYDIDMSGFVVRCSPTSKRFYVKTAFKGGKYNEYLGDWPNISVSMAREIAQKFFGKIYASNYTSSYYVCNYTLGEIWDKEVRVFYQNERSFHTAAQYSSVANKYLLPRFKDCRLHDINSLQYKRYYFEVQKESKQCAYMMNIIVKRIFQTGMDLGMIPTTAEIPTAGIPRYKQSNPRHDWIQPKDIVKFFEAVYAEPVREARCAVLLYLLTGLRKMELMHLRWEDIDWKARSIMIANNKAQRPFMVPITSHIFSILESLKSEDGKTELYVFPDERCANGRGKRNSFYDSAWKRIKNRCGLKNITLHSLRHTFASWLVQRGVDIYMVGRMLNQSTVSVTERYSHVALKSRRKIVEKHGRTLSQFIDFNKVIGNGEQENAENRTSLENECPSIKEKILVDSNKMEPPENNPEYAGGTIIQLESRRHHG